MKQSQPKVHTPSSAADQLGVTPQYIRALCQQHEIGEKLPPDRWMLYPQHIAKLEKLLGSMPPRRPRISAGG